MLTVYPTGRSRGMLQLSGQRYVCALGRNGVRSDKREGDGATPAGTFALRQIFYRADRLAKPRSGLPVRALTQRDGWCDDPAHRAYNRLVQLPFDASHEALWRSDGLYDLIVTIGHNDDPPRPGFGSAIFIHCATDDLAPTQGCIALTAGTLEALVPHLHPALPLWISDRPDQAP